MILLIVISFGLVWFLTDIIKDYFFYIKKESFIVSEIFSSNENKVKIFIKKFVFSFVKAISLIFTYIIIYSALDSGILVNAILFFLIIISVRIVPEFLFLFQKSTIPKKVIIIETVSCSVEYLIMSIILSALMS